jgi:putative transposase
VNDVLMIVCDGLTGLTDAISTVWPQTITQTCVVHLLRNSFRYAGRQHYDAIAKALRPVYTVPTEAAAMERFLEFAETWGERYPAIVRLWENAWAEFVPFLSFDVEIRRVIATTNARASTPESAGR